jgi:hypothetical protein
MQGKYVQLWGDFCTNPIYEDGMLERKNFSQAQANLGKNAKNDCWGYSANRTISWYFQENGKKAFHRGLIGEHNFYLLGYEGTLNDPINIIVWDTQTGRHIYPVEEWMRKWRAMDYRSVIIDAFANEKNISL